MTRSFRMIATGTVAISLTWLIAGCPSTTTGDNTGGNTTGDSLSATESAGIESAMNSVASMTNATTTLEGSTAGEDNQTALDIPESGSLDFGTCPEVSLSAGGSLSNSNVQLSLAIDFGDGCSPLDNENYEVSGSVSGSYDQGANMINASFDDLTVNSQSLTGDAEVTFSRTSTQLGLSGTWDLTYAEGSDAVSTNGDGNATYMFSSMATTISTFSGTITDASGSWTATMTNVQTSFAQYENFVPFGGTMVLAGVTPHTLTLTFDTNSPTTGVMLVSIDNGTPFEYTLAGF